MTLAWEANVFKWANTCLYSDSDDNAMRWWTHILTHLFSIRTWNNDMTELLRMNSEHNRTSENHFSCPWWTEVVTMFSHLTLQKRERKLRLFVWRCVSVGGKVREALWESSLSGRAILVHQGGYITCMCVMSFVPTFILWGWRWCVWCFISFPPLGVFCAQFYLEPVCQLTAACEKASFE